MRFPGLWRWLRRCARDLLARTAARYGYVLVRAERLDVMDDDGDEIRYERILRGRQEPFATAEYDVLPLGGFDFVRRDYYSPIPDLESLDEAVWSRCSELGGVRLDASAGIDFIERELGGYTAELSVPIESPSRAGEFFLRNTSFESVDAEILYSMIRFARPARVVELGSGYSTLLINMALRRNEAEGASAQHVVYDPFPREEVLGASLPEPSRLEPISATEVSLAVFDELQAGDVLFVDTTHTVKLASDVNFIVLDVLPRLQPGVFVHFHDVFLPWEYPRDWFTKMRYYWAEQYLLQAFLAFNDAFSVLVPAQAVARQYPDRLRASIPSFADGASPGSLWLRVSGGRERTEPTQVAETRQGEL